MNADSKTTAELDGTNGNRGLAANDQPEDSRQQSVDNTAMLGLLRDLRDLVEKRIPAATPADALIQKVQRYAWVPLTLGLSMVSLGIGGYYYVQDARLVRALVAHGETALHEKKDYETAANLFGEVLKRKKNHKKATEKQLVARANLGLQTGDMEEITTDLRTYVRISREPFLKLLLAQLYHSSNELDEAKELLIDLGKEDLAQEREVDRIYYLSSTRRRLGELSDAEAGAHKCIDVAGSINYRLGEVQCNNALGWVLRDQEKHHEAVNVFENNIKHLESMDPRNYDPAILISAYDGVAQSHRFNKEFGKAAKNYKRELVLARASGMKQSEARIENNLGVLCFVLGDYEAAFRHLNRALKIKRKIGIDTFSTLCNLCQNEARAGRLERAERYCAEAQLGVQLSRPVHKYGLGLSLAELFYRQNNLPEARLWLEKAEEAIEDHEILRRYSDDLESLKELIEQEE